MRKVSLLVHTHTLSWVVHFWVVTGVAVLPATSSFKHMITVRRSYVRCLGELRVALEEGLSALLLLPAGQVVVVGGELAGDDGDGQGHDHHAKQCTHSPQQTPQPALWYDVPVPHCCHGDDGVPHAIQDGREGVVTGQKFRQVHSGAKHAGQRQDTQAKQ